MSIKRERCPYCYEYIDECICTFYTCEICGAELPEHLTYEYRGHYCCGDHIDDLHKKIDERRRIQFENEYS